MSRATLAFFSTSCPHCRSIEFRSVGATNFIESAFRWLAQPCRCSFCGHHFFLFRWLVPAAGAT
jgi:hypothetical protein